MQGKVRQFGDVKLMVHHNDGRPVGSLVEWNELRFELPQWPARIQNITESATHLVVTLKSGQKRYLDASDAVRVSQPKVAPAEVYSATSTLVESYEQAPSDEDDDALEPRTVEVSFDPASSVTNGVLLEGEQVTVGERNPRPRYDLDMNELHDEARALYEATGSATPNGRQYIATAGIVELQSIIRRLQEALRLEVPQADKESFAELEEAADSLRKASTHKKGLAKSPGKSDNWVERHGDGAKGGKGGQLPAYIQHIALAIKESGKDTSTAIAYAVNAVKRWAAGGGSVDSGTQAAALKALREWEHMKGKARMSEAEMFAEAERLLDEGSEPFTESAPVQTSTAAEIGRRVAGNQPKFVRSQVRVVREG